MNAMKGMFDDGTGRFTKRGEPDQKMAIQHMFDEDYHRHKATMEAGKLEIDELEFSLSGTIETAVKSTAIVATEWAASS